MNTMLVASYDGGAIAGVIFIYLVVYIVISVIWGLVTQKVAENKGYYDHAFWWGFFLGLIGLIVILVRPDNNRPIYSNDPRYMGYTQQQSKRWYCTRCGTENGLSNTCVTCGERRYTASRGSGPVPNGGWRCSCGAVNPAYVGTCGCGLAKGATPPKYSSAQPANTGSTPATSTAKSSSSSKFDEIKAYKELLDCGAITQEDYDKKKAEILGL